jgi:PIN domain nuclease of toxin-antitoxin system
LRLLLDAHAFLWWIAGEGLTKAAETAIEDDANEVWVGAGTTWEIATKRAQGRLEDGPDDLIEEIRQNAFRPLPILVEHTVRAAGLPRIHGDPFDRMLVAQAQHDGLTIVTRDAAIARYQVAVLGA